MRFSLAALLCLALPGVGVGSLLAQESPNPRLLRASILVARGARALDVGNLHKAQTNFTKALKVLPDLPEAHLGLGQVLMNRRQFNAALEKFLRAEDCYLRKTASVLELRRERYAAAQARASDLQRRLHILRENIDRHEALGGDASGRSEERQKRLGSSLQLEVRQIEAELDRLETIPVPSPPTEDGVPAEVYYFIGNALLYLERADAAVQAWAICAERNPSFTPAQNNLAAGYLKLGQPCRAQASLELARLAGAQINSALDQRVREACAADPSPDGE